MNLLKLYEEILKTGLMSVDHEGMVSQPKSYSAEEDGPVEPTVIDGKRLVIPTKYHIDNPDKQQKIVFHPLSENALQGESAVISKLKTMCSVAVNMSIYHLIRNFLNLALSTEEHKKLSPEQSELLSVLKDVDTKTEKDFMKIILQGIKRDGSDGLFFKVFLKRGGSVHGKKYSRVGVVTFPIYEELSKENTEHFGITLRKKDQGVLRKLLEYILPRIAEVQGYDAGSDDDNAPYLEALMQSIAGVGGDVNKRINEFEEFIDFPEGLKIKLRWQKAFQDLNDFLPEVRRIPSQYGNQGNRKVEENLKDEQNIQSSVNEAAQQAMHRSEAVKENVVRNDTPVPPWEDNSRNVQPVAQPQPTNAAFPLPVNLSSPVMQGYPQGYPMQNMQPMQQAEPSRPGTISASELLGVSAQGMPVMPNYPQGYPNRPMMPGYPQPQGFYPQQPMMPQQQPIMGSSPFL